MQGKKPPYLRIRSAADGAKRYSWEPNPALARAGWPTVPLGLNDEAAAVETAERINELVAEWRAGRLTQIPPLVLGMKRLADPIHARRRLARPPAVPGTVGWIVERYLESDEYAELRPHSRRSYRPYMDTIRRLFGDQPPAAVSARVVKELYKSMRVRTPVHAAKMIRHGRLLWKWAKSEGMVAANPWLDVQVKTPKPKVPDLWTPQAVRVFVETADEMGWRSLGTAVWLNEWLGQRKGDVLEWRRPGPGAPLRVTQQKTGAVVVLPVSVVPKLAARIEADRAWWAGRGISPTHLIVDEVTGQPYTDSVFRNRFEAVRAKASAPDKLPMIADLDFMHLRHTAVTRLSEAGCSIRQIAAITGHTMGSVLSILERYSIHTAKLAEGALLKRLAAEAGEAADGQDGGEGEENGW
ncbi:MAG TPA: tyrosine-type recombinase/integrase [Azospirillaceae bacterium]|nr:tyrosine-type recombinase/integrase [Azospirillaceae bacterium]